VVRNVTRWMKSGGHVTGGQVRASGKPGAAHRSFHQ
jgi:hypothetical protein